MKFSPGDTLKKGLSQIVDHPQLWLTVVVALAIVGSFVFVADRFIQIARDAQDKLVNVRVGSLQDAFTPMAGAFMSDPMRLTGYMQQIKDENPTITDFQIAQNINGDWTTELSTDNAQIGKKLVGMDFLVSLAKADPRNSFTITELSGDQRYFRTARAILDASSSVIGIALTRQTLSEADRSIGASIQTSILVLIVILVLLLILFFHHARIVDYTALYRRLKEVDQLKDDFIGMVSHELRTPLMIIRGYIGEMRLGKSDFSQSEMLDRIDHGADVLNLLVADMLDVARIEQRRMPFNLIVMDPTAVITEVCGSLRAVAQGKGLSISCVIDPDTKIKADGDRLRQVVTNLVNNAVKYSDKGEIAVTGKKENGNFVLRVSDNGIGMTAEDQAKLFSKFNRAAGERVRREVGTGLGLWITKQIVEAMGGKISVESIKGVGSHFVVTMSLAK